MVVPRALRIIWSYWFWLTMVAKAGGYHFPHFKGYRNVTQVDPLSPMIFNVVVDTVIYHWVMVVAAEEVGAGVLGASIHDLAAYFCTDDRLVVLTQPERLQRALDILSDLFDWLGLRHRRDLPVLHNHEIMVIYPYPFLVVINLLLSCILFINDCICILTGSPG